jgi:hypothetical protein
MFLAPKFGFSLGLIISQLRISTAKAAHTLRLLLTTA